MKVDEPTGSFLFEEKQGFPKWLNILMISPFFLTLATTLIIGYVAGPDRSGMWIILSTVLPLELLMYYLFSATRFEKIVTTAGLYYRWAPIQKKYRVFEREIIQGIELRKPPAFHFGSTYVWGYGWMHSVTEGEGVQLLLSTGKKVFIGTSDKVSFEKALKEMIPLNPKSSFSER